MTKKDITRSEFVPPERLAAHSANSTQKTRRVLFLRGPLRPLW